MGDVKVAAAAVKPAIISVGTITETTEVTWTLNPLSAQWEPVYGPGYYLGTCRERRVGAAVDDKGDVFKITV